MTVDGSHISPVSREEYSWQLAFQMLFPTLREFSLFPLFEIFKLFSQNYDSMVNNYDLHYPVPLFQVFICCGFFVVYFIEEITAMVWFFQRREVLNVLDLKVFGSEGHSHGHSHGPPKPMTVDIKKENVTRYFSLLISFPKQCVVLSLIYRFFLAFPLLYPTNTARLLLLRMVCVSSDKYSWRTGHLGH